jgi:hypothetical protein
MPETEQGEYAVLYVKEKGRITNLEYLEINKGITDRTALRDLDRR